MRMVKEKKRENTSIKKNLKISHEKLYRKDHKYDFIVLFVNECCVKNSSDTLQSTSTIAFPIPNIFIKVFL